MPINRDNIPYETRRESIANADARLNNAGLPTYSELREAAGNLTYDGTPDKECSEAELRLRALLNRIYEAMES